jgi:hypothetical protein
MSLHFFSTSSDGGWIPILQELELLIGVMTIHLHRNIRDLLEATRQNQQGRPVILMVGDDDELDGLLAAEPLLRGQRLVLVLHDSSTAALFKGHALRPRVLFSPPVEPAEIAQVVAKMLARQGAEQQIVRR